MIVLFIVAVQTIIMLGHWFLYRSFLFFFDLRSSRIKFFLRAVLIPLSITFVVSSRVALGYANWFIKGWYVFSTAWMGFFFLLFQAACLAWLVYFAAKLLVPAPRKKLLAGLFFGFALAAGAYGIINASSPRITNLTMHLPGLPSAWRGKTAVLVSDIHLGQIRREHFSKITAELINNERPDIVFIGGDMYDGVVADLPLLTSAFSGLSPSWGTYYVTGNHEEFSSDAPYISAVQKAGVHVLKNEKISIEGLQIIGVDYSDSYLPEDFRNLLREADIDREKPSILIKHSPGNYAISEEEGISLQLSGHTHGGQIWPVNFITSLFYQGHDYGLTNFGNMQIYTTSGAGTWGIPMRIGTVPEVAVIRFE